jgi:hypothetical protein
MRDVQENWKAKLMCPNRDCNILHVGLIIDDVEPRLPIEIPRPPPPGAAGA